MLEHDMQRLLFQTDAVSESRDVRAQAELVRLEFRKVIREAQESLEALRENRSEAALKAE